MSAEIPSIPFSIVTEMRVGTTLRRETRNANNLPQAMEIYEKELHKPTTRVVRIQLTIVETFRRGGNEG